MIAVITLSTIASAMSAVPAWLSKKFVDDVLINQNKEMFLWIIGGIFVATVIKVVSSYYSEITSNFVTETIKREIKIDIFSHFVGCCLLKIQHLLIHLLFLSIDGFDNC